MPKISCVMPTRNRAGLIAESIRSILDQTEKDWELIIVDDHSDLADKTEEVIGRFSDNRIKYFRLPDGNGMGTASARNFGNHLASGKYIAVVDSDDICYPNRLALTLAEFKKGADLVYGVIDVWDGNDSEVKIRDDKYAAREFDLEYFKQFDFIPHPTVAYKKEIILNFPYNSFFKKAQDYDLLSRLHHHGFKFNFITTPIVKYRQHLESNTRMPSDGIDYAKQVRINRGWKK
jgi:glycosyltransferase involved in cell wall biosynthesis